MTYEGLLLLALWFVATGLFNSVTFSLHGDWLKLALQGWLLGATAAYFCWLWVKGQTLPMKTWHIRVVNLEHNKLRLSQALLRFLLALILPVISQLWAFVDSDGQFLHDHLAGTRLVSTQL